MDLNLLGLFVAVAETGSFSETARRLGLPKASVSRGVASLEASVGTQLVHRTTRHVSLSTAGAALYERAAPLLASLKEAVGTLPEREEASSGELRLTAPHDMGATFLSEVIARFTARYPSVRVDCRLTNRNVDLVAEGFDLALRLADVPRPPWDAPHARGPGPTRLRRVPGAQVLPRTGPLGEARARTRR